jgi:hypothetical protein
MNEGSVERTVVVWGKQHTVDLYRKSRTVWAVVGTYLGERIEVQDSSAAAALKRWRNAAHERGN